MACSPNIPACSSLLFIVLSVFLMAPADAYYHNRKFMALGTGTGNSRFKNGSIPYFINMTKQSNKDKAPAALKRAADHIRLKTCVNFYEIDLATQQTLKAGQYVLVRDTIANSCSAGGWLLNFDGCGSAGRDIIMHEMLHILGVKHEQMRVDSYNKINVHEDRIKPDFVSQYTAPIYSSHGEYDFMSIMHYGSYAFGLTSEATYDATQVDFNVGCRALSKGDIETVEFVTQKCYQEPMAPMCGVSSPSGLIIGSKFNNTISFTAQYQTQKLTATFANLPEGSAVIDKKQYRGGIYLVQLTPTANDLGKNFSITATFSTSDGQHTTDCAVEVQVSPAEYICDNIPSTSPSVCSGHGACVSNDFPQCECQPGFAGPFCEGVPKCLGDVVMDFEDDDPMTNCLVPEDDEFGNRVAGPSGMALNHTRPYINFMRKIDRQPSEVSFLLRLATAGTYSVSTSAASLYLRDGFLGSVKLGNDWNYFRIVYDWNSKQYNAFVNGTWAYGGKFYGSLVSRFTVSAPTDGYVQLDRLRVHCAASHIAMTTSGELSAKGRLLNDVDLMLIAPASVYQWATNPTDLCTSTDPTMFDGAIYTVNETYPNKLMITLPATGSKPRPANTQYITCTPKPSHFVQPSSGLNIVEPDLFAVAGVSGLCSGSEHFYYEDITDSTSQRPVFASPQPTSMRFKLDVTPTSSWEARVEEVTSSSYQYAFYVRVQNNYGRMQLYNMKQYATLSDDRFKTLDSIEFTVDIDWPAQNLTLRVLNLTLTTSFNASGLTGARMWFWSGVANGTLSLQTECPPSEVVPMPALFKGWTSSGTPSTAAPSTSSPPTVPDTSGAPTTPTTAVSDAPTTGGDGATSTAAPNNTAGAPDTTDNASAAPVTQSTVSAAPDITETSPPVVVDTSAPTPPPALRRRTRRYRVRLLGKRWNVVLSSLRSRLEDRIKTDVSTRLQINKERIVIVNLSIGSLLIDLSITSDDDDEPSLADAPSVAQNLQETDYVETKAIYVEGGGNATESLAVSGVTVTDDGSGIQQTPNPPQSPQSSTPSNEFSCSRGCVVMMVLSIGCVLGVVLMIVVLSGCCKRPPPQKEVVSKTEPYYPPPTSAY